MKIYAINVILFFKIKILSIKNILIL